MSGMYEVFETDEKLESSGVWIDYGDFRVLISSAGQGNKRYVKYAERKFKPVRRAIEANALGQDRSLAIMADIYAVTIVQKWEIKDPKAKDKLKAKWISGIENHDPNSSPLAVTAENVVQTLLNLPRLFTDLIEQAASLDNFRKAELDMDSGNS